MNSTRPLYEHKVKSKLYSLLMFVRMDTSPGHHIFQNIPSHFVRHFHQFLCHSFTPFCPARSLLCRAKKFDLSWQKLATSWFWLIAGFLGFSIFPIACVRVRLFWYMWPCHSFKQFDNPITIQLCINVHT